MSDSSDDYEMSDQDLSDAPAPRHSARARQPKRAIVELSDSEEDEDESEADLSDEDEDEGDSDFSVHEKKKTPAKKHVTPKAAAAAPKPTPAKKTTATPAKKPTPARAAPKPALSTMDSIADATDDAESTAAAEKAGGDEGEGEGEGEDGAQQAKKPRAKAAPKTMATTVALKLPPRATESWLMQCDEDPDLEGDIGAVGRLYVEPDNKSAPLKLDLKGNTFEGSLAPCNTFMLVRIKDDEARIDTFINHYFDVTCTGSVLDKETLLEGHLDDDDFADQSVVADEDEWAPTVPGTTATGKKESGKPKKKKMKLLDSADVAPAVKKATAKKPRKSTAGKAKKTGKKTTAKASAKKSAKAKA